MELKEELTKVKVKTAKTAVKQKNSNIVPEVKNDNDKKQESFLPENKKQLTEKPEPKKENKRVIQITGQPKTSEIKNNDGVMIDFEITPEMIEATLKGIFGTIHMLAPKTFSEPTDRNIQALKSPTVVVVKRWLPKVDILKYLPEITLAAGIIATLQSMRIEPEKKT